MKDEIREGLSSLVKPTVPAKSPDIEPLQISQKPKYKTCNYVTDPSHHNRLKRYATDSGMTLLQAFNAAIDLYLSDKGERYI